MDKQERELLGKLLAKAERELGLDPIDHRKLSRLIEQADAEEALLITGESPGKVIYTSGSGEPMPTPRSQKEAEEVKL